MQLSVRRNPNIYNYVLAQVSVLTWFHLYNTIEDLHCFRLFRPLLVKFPNFTQVPPATLTAWYLCGHRH